MLRFHVAVADARSRPVRLRRCGGRAIPACRLSRRKTISRPVCTSGTGNGQSSSPTRRNARSPSSGPRKRSSFSGLGGEIRRMLPVLRCLASEDDVVAVGTEDRGERRHVKLLGRIDQRVGGLLRSIEQPATCDRRAVADGVFLRRRFRSGLRAGKQAHREARRHRAAHNGGASWKIGRSRISISYQCSLDFASAIQVAYLRRPPPPRLTPPPPPRLKLEEPRVLLPRADDPLN